MLGQNTRQLLKHSSIYSLGWIANAVAGVLLLPVYTKFMSVEDYGSVDLVQQTNAIMKIMLISTFTYSVGRFFFDAKTDKEKSRVLSTSAMSVLVISACAAVVGFLFRSQLSGWIFGDPNRQAIVSVGVGLLFFEMVYGGLTYQFLVGKKSITFVLLSLLKLATAISVNLICIVGLGLGAIGMLWGNLGSCVPVCLVAFYMSARDHGMKIELDLAKRMFWFAYPMIIAGLLATVMHNADRFLLRPLGSLEQVGFFTVGLLFPAMLNSILLSSFNSVWGGAMMFEISKQPDADRQIGKLATYCMTVFVLMQASLGILSVPLLNFLADDKFTDAAAIVPIVCLGYGFHAFYTFLVSKAFTDGKPNRMVAAYAVPVAFKILLSFLFVPRFGYLASAWIMSASYGIFSLTCYLLFRKQNTIEFDFRRLAFIFTYCAAFLTVAEFIQLETSLADAAFRTLLVGVMFLILGISPFFARKEKNAAVSEISRFLGKFVTPIDSAAGAK